ncbi:MAG: hypothetical protein K2L01_06185 [Rikenellaceae bacterium]|nr:hypothetical protein [Rikenellaceae bacterium]
MKISVKIVVSAFALSALAMSCGTTQTDEVKNYDLNSFDVIDFSATEPERVSPNEMTMGMPYGMCMVSDSIMALKDPRAGQMQLWLLNVNSGKFAQCLYNGSGPKECLGVTNIWADGGYLFAGGYHDYKIMKIAVDPDSLTTDIECIAEMPEFFLKAVTLSDSCLLYAPSMVFDARFLLARMDGTVTDTIREFYIMDRLPEGLRPQNSMAQMQMTLSPDKRHLVSSNMAWPVTEIYTVPLNKTIVMEGPVKTDSKVKVVNDNMGTSYVVSPVGLCFSVFPQATTVSRWGLWEESLKIWRIIAKVPNRYFFLTGMATPPKR